LSIHLSKLSSGLRFDYHFRL